MKWYRKITNYFTTEVWKKGKGDFKTKKGFWLTRFLQLMIYTIKGVGRHGSFIRSAALTFFTIMSLVPMLALGFGVIKAFGLEEQINVYFFSRFPQYSELIETIVAYADGVLTRTRGGIVAFTGLVLLVWAAIRVFVNVESAFNTIWEVKRKRSLTRKVSAYMGVIFVVPILLVGFSVLVSYIRDILVGYKFMSPSIFYTIGSMLALCIIFALIYKVVPYTKVKWNSAIFAGAMASIAFMIFQAIYIYIQNGVTAYNLIYGSFAAIPLFLLWIQISWQIVLIGAELSFSFQNIDSYMEERDAEDISYDSRRKVTLASLLIIVKNFSDEKGGMTSEQISRELKLPLRLIRDVLFDLENAGLVIAGKSPESEKINIYIPAKDLRTITFYGALQAVEEVGKSVDTKSNNRDLKHVARKLNSMKEWITESEYNLPLIDLKKNESDNTGKRKRS